MKRLAVILFFFGTVSFYSAAQDQNQKTQTNNELIHAIVGKWKIIKYESEQKTPAKPSAVEFRSDGTFVNDGVIFKTPEGMFRTNEDRGSLILENGDQVTEWKTSLKKGVLQMDLIPKFNQTKVNITLVRIAEGE
jgi:hypothetical protein